MKLFGGGVVAIVLTAAPGEVSGRRLLADAALVALAANLGNLLDRAPGRTIKVGLLVYVPLALAAGTSPVGLAVASVVGAAAGLLHADLRERLMLGDTGANLLGAVLGLAVVLETSRPVRTAVLIVLVLSTSRRSGCRSPRSSTPPRDCATPTAGADSAPSELPPRWPPRRILTDVERHDRVRPPTAGGSRRSARRREVVERAPPVLAADGRRRTCRAGGRHHDAVGVHAVGLDAEDRGVNEVVRRSAARPPDDARIIADGQCVVGEEREGLPPPLLTLRGNVGVQDLPGVDDVVRPTTSTAAATSAAPGWAVPGPRAAQRAARGATRADSQSGAR